MPLPQQTDLRPEIPQYIEETEEHAIVALDPVSGEAMEPGKIPESLAAIPQLREGYDFLHDNADRVHFGVLLSTHERAEDLRDAGIDLAAESKALAEKGGVLFLEGVGPRQHREEMQKLADYVVAQEGEKLEGVRSKLDALESSGTFRIEVLRQIAGSKVEVAFPDYLVDNDQPADMTLRRWNEDFRAMIQEQDTSDEATEKLFSTNMGFTYYRDWYLVGKMGHYLAQREAEAGDDSHAAPIEGRILVGTNHANIAGILESFGMAVDVIGKEPEKDLRTAQLVKAVGKAALTLDDRIDFRASLMSERRI